ncbi:MAG: hypothetical protein J6T57_00380 [Alphaproteobacteria bacterium]|nr:hypothetical protein [Alphaproteobacteria bacterium]
MKKKIVYISGADVFDVNEVRAAFDEVRNTLNLGADTVLFGVPVDAATESVDESNLVDCTANPVAVADNTDSEPDESIKIARNAAPDTPFVPILSVLGGGADEISLNAVAPESDNLAEDASDDTVSEAHSDIENDDIIESDSEITEMLDDDLPDDPSEKTLEELLETMAPLREDIQQEQSVVDEQKNDVISGEEVDATLENLASEFANTQVNVPTSKKGSERGRIGKLKNILPLPFKKAKRDDSGIMGDLFGWAGIAANDEDFTIPGFFTNAVGRK